MPTVDGEQMLEANKECIRKRGEAKECGVIEMVQTQKECQSEMTDKRYSEVK